MDLPRFPGGLVVPQEFLDGILPRLKAPSIDNVKQVLLSVMQDYFRHSGCWRMWAGPITVGGPSNMTPGRRVPIPPPAANVMVHTTFGVVDASGYALGRLSPMRFDMRDPRLLGAPSSWYQATPGVLVLDQVPGEEQGASVLGAYVSISPLDLCVPPNIRAEHYNGLCDGVMEKMCRVRGPNYDLRAAAAYRYDYIRQRSEARWGAETGYSAEQTVAHGFPFARGSQRRGAAVWRS